jgi:hypothetical protein
LSKPPITATEETGLIRILEAPNTPSRTLVSPLDWQVCATKVDQRIDPILNDYKGLPNGKNKRTKLTQSNAKKFKLALTYALGYASVWASTGPLPNRVRRRGRPPDNACFLFLDDIMRAFEVAGLKAGLRYVKGSESLPVRVYIKLAPLLWPGKTKNPRKLFERWQRLRSDLRRG